MTIFCPFSRGLLKNSHVPHPLFYMILEILYTFDTILPNENILASNKSNFTCQIIRVPKVTVPYIHDMRIGVFINLRNFHHTHNFVMIDYSQLLCSLFEVTFSSKLCSKLCSQLSKYRFSWNLDILRIAPITQPQGYYCPLGCLHLKCSVVWFGFPLPSLLVSSLDLKSLWTRPTINSIRVAKFSA